MPRIRITKEQFYKKLSRVKKTGISDLVESDTIKIFMQRDKDKNLKVNTFDKVLEETTSSIIKNIEVFESAILRYVWNLLYKRSYGWVY